MMADNLLSTDADPEPPRSLMNVPTADLGQGNLVKTNNMERQIQRDTQPPTIDWKFKNFIVALARQITSSDLDELKIIFSGKGGIGHGVLSEIETPGQLFTKLEQRCWLSPDNLLILQRALQTIDRMDLVRTAAEYAQSIDNVLHFYPASSQPENGYRSVRLHIRGRNFQNASRDDIQQFRFHIAELLFAPPECIIIAGVEPSTSLILTLYIPEAYVELLKDMLETNADQSRFKSIGIDLIEIQHFDGMFHLKETEIVKSKVKEQHNKLYTIYQQLEITKKQLEDSEMEHLKLQKSMQEYEKKSLIIEALLKTMRTKRNPSTDDSEGPALFSNDFNDLFLETDLAVDFKASLQNVWFTHKCRSEDASEAPQTEIKLVGSK